MAQPNLPGDWSVPGRQPRFWVLVLLSGVASGLGGGLLMLLLRATQHLSYGYSSGSFLPAVERSSDLRRVVVLAGAGVFAGVAWLLLRRIAGKGSGLSESVWEHAGQMSLPERLINAALQIVIVGLGASLGREGAPKEVGAAVASSLSSRAGLSDPQRRLLVACGAGAGMAAVYNVPLGGALFAVEVLLGSITLPLVLPALLTSLIATAVAWTMLPNQPTYHLPAYGVSSGQLAWAVLFGPVAGVVAVGYIRLIAGAKSTTPRGWRLISATTTVFTGLGVLAIGYPQLLGNGRDIAQLAFVGRVGLPLLAAMVVLKPLATAACLRSGARGGLFTPTLTFGAMLGGTCGHLWAGLWPGAPVASYAVIGAAAILAASMQAPVSSVALVVELTSHEVALMVPMLLAVVLASFVARLLDDRSIYSAPLRHGS